MTDLIACLSTGKGTWGHIARLVQDENWTKIFLITNEFGKENFNTEKKAEFIVVNQAMPLKDLRDDIYQKLGNKLDSEVALNLISGTGKEHMAILSALLKLGVGIRLIAITKDGIEEV